MSDFDDRGEVRDLHAGQDLIYNDIGRENEGQAQERYYKLLIIHIVSMAITCVLLIVNIMKTDQTLHQLRDQRQDIIHYLNSAEENIMLRMDANFRVMNQELKQSVNKQN